MTVLNWQGQLDRVHDQRVEVIIKCATLITKHLLFEIVKIQ